MKDYTKVIYQMKEKTKKISKDLLIPDSNITNLYIKN